MRDLWPVRPKAGQAEHVCHLHQPSAVNADLGKGKGRKGGEYPCWLVTGWAFKPERQCAMGTQARKTVCIDCSTPLLRIAQLTNLEARKSLRLPDYASPASPASLPPSAPPPHSAGIPSCLTLVVTLGASLAEGMWANADLRNLYL